MVIYTVMRTHTGKNPANLQVLSGLIYSKSQLFVMTQIFPLVLLCLPLSFCCAMRTHAGQKPEQLQVLSECTYPTNMIACIEKCMPTILIGTCAQFLCCHENTYWWEAHQTTCAARSYSLTKHGCNNKMVSLFWWQWRNWSHIAIRIVRIIFSLWSMFAG